MGGSWSSSSCSEWRTWRSDSWSHSQRSGRSHAAEAAVVRLRRWWLRQREQRHQRCGKTDGIEDEKFVLWMNVIYCNKDHLCRSFSEVLDKIIIIKEFFSHNVVYEVFRLYILVQIDWLCFSGVTWYLSVKYLTYSTCTHNTHAWETWPNCKHVYIS